jgi:RND family efflux transporter MFP subunit
LSANEVEIIVTVDEAKIGQLRPGQPVSISVPAYPGRPFAGTVAGVSEAGEARSRAFQARIVPASHDGMLKPGMSADVRVSTESRVAVALAPAESVVRRAGKDYVYVVEGQSGAERARLIEVETGIGGPTGVEIVKGVQAGQRLVLEGQAGLNDGDTVRVLAAG